MTRSPAQTLERLERLLENLEEAGERGVPILVEGKKDVRSLRASGITGPVVMIHRGERLFPFCEKLAKEHGEVIVLTDADRQGGRIARAIKEAFILNGSKVDLRSRRELFQMIEGNDVESLAPFLRRVRAMVEKRGEHLI